MVQLGAPLVAKHIMRDCDGQCGGTITLTTDGTRLAYAATVHTAPGYHAQQALVDIADGVVSVSCQALGRSEETCDGGFEVTTDYLSGLPWIASPAIKWMEDVKR